MEALLTGDHMTGVDAVASGMANRAFNSDDLDHAVLEIAERIAKIQTTYSLLINVRHIVRWRQLEYEMGLEQLLTFKL